MRNNIEKHVGNSNVTDNPIELFDYCEGFTETPMHRREVNTKTRKMRKKVINEGPKKRRMWRRCDLFCFFDFRQKKME